MDFIPEAVGSYGLSLRVKAIGRLAPFCGSVQAGRATWTATLMSVMIQKCFGAVDKKRDMGTFYSISQKDPLMGLWKNTWWPVLWEGGSFLNVMMTW